MRKILIALGLMFAIGAATDQEQGTNVLGLKLGIAIPTGDFAETDDGAAESGFGFELTSERYFMENLSAILILRRQANSLDAQGMAEDLSRDFPGYNIKVETDNWAVEQYLLGFHVLLPIGESNIVSLSSRFAAGLTIATSPDVTAKFMKIKKKLELTLRKIKA